MSCAFSSVRAPSEILSTSKQTSMSNRYACYLNPCNKYSRCTSLKKKKKFFFETLLPRNPTTIGHTSVRRWTSRWKSSLLRGAICIWLLIAVRIPRNNLDNSKTINCSNGPAGSDWIFHLRSTRYDYHKMRAFGTTVNSIGKKHGKQHSI